MLSNILDVCVMCRKGGEKIDHLFIHCEVVYLIWCHFINKCGLSWCNPNAISEMAHGGGAGPGGLSMGVVYIALAGRSLHYHVDNLEERGFLEALRLLMKI